MSPGRIAVTLALAFLVLVVALAAFVAMLVGIPEIGVVFGLALVAIDFAVPRRWV